MFEIAGKKLFTKMVLKAKKETPAPPRAEAKAKALKAKKAVLNGVHNHKKEDPPSPTFPRPRHGGSQRSSEKRPQETQAWPLCHYRVPLTTESAVRKTEDDATLLTVGVRASQLQRQQAGKRLCDIDGPSSAPDRA